jgi:septation ring formation regulator EzrA
LRNNIKTEMAELMPALQELSDKELRAKLSTRKLSNKKATIARALLRRRRQERFQAWLKRHAWMGAILAAIGLVGIFSIS